MIIGVPKETKDQENRIALTPDACWTLTQAGHKVLVERSAGAGSSFGDEQYADAGVALVEGPAEVYGRADMVVKVKEPLPPEYSLLRAGQLLFCYLHLAAEPVLADTLLTRQVTAIAFETVQINDGSLPLLAPMSEIAGRLSVQVAARLLERTSGGPGKLLGGAIGVSPSEVAVLGAGSVGTAAAQVALGMGAHVTVLDIKMERLRYLKEVLHGNLTVLASNTANIAATVRNADVLIDAVLVPGGRTPRLVTRQMVSTMAPGSVIVAVDIDQGGAVETCRPTSHSQPTFVAEGVTHYCVTNMPGAVSHTATQALSIAILPYVLRLANLGFARAVGGDARFAPGVNTYAGVVTHPKVAEALGKTYVPLDEAMRVSRSA
ncbi:MAG: alanine dehydrogenase [Bacteroidetes bacterium]|nr:alanine dehydrogenase [Bacteroidota bacterium]MCL5026994.1 alanine dehydrogenase [Chloroflexota bacterium]